MKKTLPLTILLVVTLCAVISNIAFAERYNVNPLVNHGKIDAFEHATQAQILAEPQLDAVSLAYAESHGGPLTQLFLNKLKQILSKEDYQSLLINIKTPILKPGLLPESGNWHCDFYLEVDPDDPVKMYRPNAKLDHKARHFMLISGEPATQFFSKPVELNRTVEDWEEIQGRINALATESNLLTVPTASIIEFKGNDLHRAMPYIGDNDNGFVRYFIRASVFPKGHTKRGKDYREQVRDRFAYR